jgi:outer membrane protein assembly factor BamB
MSRTLLTKTWFAVILFTAWANGQSYEWPQWLGPDRNGLTAETGLLESWPEGGPKRLWLFENCGVGYAGPAVADGRLYILGTRDEKAQLFALDISTGKEQWAAPIGPIYRNDWGDGPRNTPAVEGDRVFALSANGVLVCVEAATGREVWRTTMESLGGSVPNWGYAESPLVDGGRVLCTPGGAEGAIAALDKQTGKVVWQSGEIPDLAHYSSIVRGEFHGRPQYVQLLEKRLVSVSPSDGKLLWEVPWPGSVAVIPTPIIKGNQVFITSGYGAGCMLVEVTSDGEPKQVYANKVMKNKHGGVVWLDDHVYGYSDDSGWVCMDATSGDRTWRERDALGMGAIGYADGKFYCIDQDEGNVVLIDASPEGWNERGRFLLAPQSTQRKDRGRIWVHPVIVDGKLFLRDQEFVYCYDVKE